MAAALLNQLNLLMANLYSTGSLDDEFHKMQMIQDGGSPDFVSEIIATFCQDGERGINKLAELLNKPCVDYDGMNYIVHQLKGSSATIGAAKVRDACIQLRKCYAQKSRDGCLKTLESLRIEFFDIRNKFRTMLQLQQQIQAYYPKE